MRLIGFLMMAVVVTTASTGFAQSEHQASRESLVLGVGAGWGNGGADFTIVEAVDRENGIVGDFRIGWAVRNDLVFGLDFDIWTQVSDAERWVFNLSALSLAYFPLDKGAFINGGVGVGTSRVELAGFGPNIQQDMAGVGAFVGGGYEWWIHDEVAVGPQIKWVYLDIDSDVTKSADYFSIMVQVTWYKPKN